LKEIKMTPIPENVTTQADLVEWYRLKEELQRVKAAEFLLRQKIFKFYFPEPKEGTNKVDLKDGTGALLKAVHKIDRTIEQGSLDALRTAIHAESSNLPKLPISNLVRYKPELVLSAYRALTAEEQIIFDQCLIIKPGSPQLEITIPKERK
jgi:hypothetical protein